MDWQVAEAETGSKSEGFFDSHELREYVILHDEAPKSSESLLVQNEAVIDHYFTLKTGSFPHTLSISNNIEKTCLSCTGRAHNESGLAGEGEPRDALYHLIIFIAISWYPAVKVVVLHLYGVSYILPRDLDRVTALLHALL